MLNILMLSSPDAACCDISRTNKDVDGRRKSGHLTDSLCVLFVLSLCSKRLGFQVSKTALHAFRPALSGKRLPHFPLVPAEAGPSSLFRKIGIPLAPPSRAALRDSKVMAGRSPAMTTGCGETFSRILSVRVSVRCVLNFKE